MAAAERAAAPMEAAEAEAEVAVAVAAAPEAAVRSSVGATWGEEAAAGVLWSGPGSVPPSEPGS